MQISGINLASFQLSGSILLSLWIVLPAWILYHEFTGSNHGAAFATIILLVQPELLFPIFRGTHEKFTRGLMFLCLYLLLRSIRCPKRQERLVGFVATFYLFSYGLISFNDLIFTSFVAAIFLGILLGIVVSWVRKDLAPKMHYVQTHLIITTLFLSILAFIYTSYIYSPAQSQLRIIASIWDRLAFLFLQAGESSTNPYTTIGIGWVSLPVYFLVSLANWLLLGFSLTIFQWRVRSWLENHYHPDPNEFLLWIFYCSFTLLSVASVVVDWSGALAANLQHRIFPSFAMLASPLVGKWLADGVSTNKRFAHLIKPVFVIVIGALAVLSPLKAFNDPIVSNQWIHYDPTEMQAIRWSESALNGNKLWVGFDHRLSSAVVMKAGLEPIDVEMDDFSLDPDVHNLLISDVISARSERLSQPLPVGADSMIVYDNGHTQIYSIR